MCFSLLTPSLTGVLGLNSSGTTLSASLSNGTSELAAAWGSFAYALKPGLTCEHKKNIEYQQYNVRNFCFL